MVQGVRQVYARMEGGLTLPDATYYWSADRSAVLDEYGIRMQELRMLARISAAAASSTAHDATHTHYTWFVTEWGGGCGGSRPRAATRRGPARLPPSLEQWQNRLLLVVPPSIGQTVKWCEPLPSRCQC